MALRQVEGLREQIMKPGAVADADDAYDGQ